MATQAEIDTALSRYSRWHKGELLYGKTIDVFEAVGESIMGRDQEVIADAYLSLLDPTPITPELLEAEGFAVNEDGIFVGHNLKVCRNWTEGEWLIQFGDTKGCLIFVRKTMGQLRLAVLLAGGE